MPQPNKRDFQIYAQLKLAPLEICVLKSGPPFILYVGGLNTIISIGVYILSKTLTYTYLRKPSSLSYFFGTFIK